MNFLSRCRYFSPSFAPLRWLRISPLQASGRPRTAPSYPHSVRSILYSSLSEAAIGWFAYGPHTTASLPISERRRRLGKFSSLMRRVHGASSRTLLQPSPTVAFRASETTCGSSRNFISEKFTQLEKVMSCAGYRMRSAAAALDSMSLQNINAACFARFLTPATIPPSFPPPDSGRSPRSLPVLP